MNIIDTISAKITTPEKIAEAFSCVRGQYPLVTTNGCFDIIHAGHIHSIAFAADYSPYVVVLINSDTSVATLKGPGRPMQNQRTRSLVMAAFQFVWRVSIFDEDTPARVLEILKPNIHVKGAEYKDKSVPELDALRAAGCKTLFAPTLPGASTTDLFNKVKNKQ